MIRYGFILIEIFFNLDIFSGNRLDCYTMEVEDMTNSLENLERRAVLPIKWGIFALCLALLFLTSPGHLPGDAPFHILLLYGGTILLYSYFFYFKRIPRKLINQACYLSYVIDVIAITLLIYLTGGLTSEFYVLFFLVILRGTSLFNTPKRTLYANIGLSLVYVLVIFLSDRSQKFFMVEEFWVKLGLIWGVILLGWFMIEVVIGQKEHILQINKAHERHITYTDKLLSSMTNGVIAADQDGMVQTINQAARDILKISDIWPLGSPISHLHPTWGKIFQRFLAEDYEYNNEMVEFKPVAQTVSCGTQLSKTLILRIYTRAMLDNRKKPGGMVAVFEDISELQRVQSQLFQSEKMASVGQLAAGVAHELGNPLGIINSCATYLASKIEKDDPSREEVEVITHEAQRCRQIIQQLLSLSTRGDINVTDLDLCGVIERALTLVQYHQEAGQIYLDWEAPEEPVMVQIDENLMIQALVNLLINAIQSMPKGGNVTISVPPQENGEEDKITLIISDQGIGIPKNQLANIFEPFYTTRENGTGLGLAIVHSIIERSGGSIEVSSEPGEGTTFTIKLLAANPENQ